MAIKILGWFGRRNSGDEAFRDVHRLLLPEHTLAWLQPGEAASFQPAADHYEDVVLVSAGDIASAFYFDYIPPGARVIVYGIGIAWPSQIAFLAGYKDRILAIWVRNQVDVEPLRAAGLNAFYTPDIAFTLDAVVPNAPPPDKPRKLAMVIVSDNMRAASLRLRDLPKFLTVQAFLYELADAIGYLSEWYDVQLVPFSFDQNDCDIGAIYDLLPRIKTSRPVQVMTEERAPLDMIAHMRAADLVVSMKFHGVIYSLMNATPFVAVSDTRKVRLVCAENGLADLYLPITGFTALAMRTAVKSAEAATTRQHIAETSAQLKRLAAAEAQRLAATLAAALVR